MDKLVDLTVVGASFAGCAVAIRAAQMGLKVRLIDKKQDPGAKLHTTGLIVRDAIDKNAFLQHIPLDLTRKIENIRLFSPSLKEILLSSPGYYFLATDTPNLMRWLTSQAIQAGVELCLGQVFTDTTHHADGIELSGIGRTRFLVGADGPQSKVAKSEGLSCVEQFLYGVEHELIGAKIADENALYCFISKKHARGYIGWAFQGTSTVQVGTGVKYRRGVALPDLSAFQTHIAPVLPLFGSDKVAVRAGFIPCGGLVKRLAAPRVLLVGDAAGLVSPVTAGGIHTAWKHGWEMGEAIALYLRGEGIHPGEVAKKSYSKFTAKKLLRWGYDHFQSDFIFNALLHTRVMRKAAEQVYFHRRG